MSHELQCLPSSTTLPSNIARLAGFWTCQMTISALHLAFLACGTVDVLDKTSGIPTLSIDDEAGGCSVRQKTTLGVGYPPFGCADAPATG
jgi:hypothetical protein